MDYELAKQLKDAGYPQECKIGDAFYHRGDLVFEGQFEDDGANFSYDHHPNLKGLYAKAPTLSELIDACGEGFFRLENRHYGTTGDGWVACDEYDHTPKATSEWGETPEEAVAKLYLALNKKQ